MKNIGVGSFVLLTGLLACSSPSSSRPFTACAIGELHGTWRVSYAEQPNGNCGPIPDETAVIETTAQAMAAQMMAVKGGCSFQAETISDDKCRLDTSFTCPLKAPYQGSSQWAGYLRQTSATTLEGPLTLDVAGSAGACRSTYDVTYTLE
jgi:hypothetical protein